MDALSATLSSLYLVSYPAFYLLQSTVSLLEWALTPFMDLGRMTLHITLLLPWRILAKFEVRVKQTRASDQCKDSNTGST